MQMLHHWKETLLGDADYILVLLSFIVAAIGIAWPGEESPKSTRIRIVLIVVVVLTAIASLLKTFSDNRDKTFLQLALSSTLLPGGSVYDSFYEDIKAAVAERAKIDKLANVEPKNVKLIPWHYSVGMIAILQSPMQGVLVLDKSDVGQMYANEIRKDPDLNREFVDTLLKKQFRPAELKEEFLDKSAIVGFLTYYERRNSLPQNYYYDLTNGITLIAPDGKTVVVSTQELISAGKDKEGKDGFVAGLVVFQRIQELFRSKL